MCDARSEMRRDDAPHCTAYDMRRNNTSPDPRPPDHTGLDCNTTPPLHTRQHWRGAVAVVMTVGVRYVLAVWLSGPDCWLGVNTITSSLRNTTPLHHTTLHTTAAYNSETTHHAAMYPTWCYIVSSHIVPRLVLCRGGVA